MMDDLPPFMSGKAKKREQNRASARQERQRANDVGGRVQAGSGSSWRAPQDVRGPIGEDGEGFLEQTKFTDASRFTIALPEWEEGQDDALRAGREHKLIIDFRSHKRRLVVTEEPYPE